MATNREMLGRTSDKRERKSQAGRPAVSEELVLRNMKLVDAFGVPRYTDRQLASQAGCSTRTIRRMRVKFQGLGLLDMIDESKKGLGTVEADFDEESKRAMGYTFSSWMTDAYSGSKAGSWIKDFNFCSLVWEKIWGKCSLVEMADRSSQLCDINARKFLDAFNEDRERIRTRIISIRFIFRFLGRKDVCDRNLKVNSTKHPRNKRSVPEITTLEFAKHWTEVEDYVRAKLGEEAVTCLRFKIVTQMRTGDKSREKECWGLKNGSEGRSYIFMESPERYQCHVFAKRGEEWDISWMPRDVRERMYEHLKEIPMGKNLWSFTSSTLLKYFREITKKVYGRELILHDLRKISTTWLYCMEVNAEVIAFLNVGWKDLNTMFNNYLQAKKLLRGDHRAEYRSNIPEWFKDGLEEYRGFDALPNQAGRNMNWGA